MYHSYVDFFFVYNQCPYTRHCGFNSLTATVQVHTILLFKGNKRLNISSLWTYKLAVATSMVIVDAHRTTTVPLVHEPRVKINLNLAALSTFMSWVLILSTYICHRFSIISICISFPWLTTNKELDFMAWSSTEH